MAREAGVSRAAVSKVIRNAYGVSPSMRDRVTAAIEALDYRPRVAARAMRGSSFTLGIEMPHIGNPFFTKIIAGATAALQGTDYQLIIAPADIDGEEGVRAIGALADRQVDGIVAISPLVAPEWLERLAARVPIVMLGRHDRAVAYDTVTGDDVEGTRLVMEHLFELGHRRIVHLTRSEEVTRPGSGNPHAVRLERYLAHMHDAGLSDSIRVVRTGIDEESARLDTLALLDEELPTAIFVGNDELALGTLRALSEYGLSPAEVSVVGYDDVDIASYPAISLTSVNQAGEAMGERAIRLLLERVQGRTEPTHFTVEPSLKVRGSTQTRTGGTDPLTRTGTSIAADRPARRRRRPPRKDTDVPATACPHDRRRTAHGSSRCAPNIPRSSSACRAPAFDSRGARPRHPPRSATRCAGTAPTAAWPTRSPSDDAIGIVAPGPALQPGEERRYAVRIATEDGWSPWSEELVVEASVDPAALEARPIGGSEPVEGPVMLLRAGFSLPAAPVRARLRATFWGVGELRINGRQATDEHLAPGWTAYHERIVLGTWDVTDLLHQGDNALGALLGDGWYRGRLGLGGRDRAVRHRTRRAGAARRRVRRRILRARRDVPGLDDVDRRHPVGEPLRRRGDRSPRRAARMGRPRLR